MKTDENRYTSGLVFLASRNCDTLELSASLQRVLEANGHRICGVQVLSETHVQVTSDILSLELSVPEQDTSTDAASVDPETDSPQHIMEQAGLVIEVALTQSNESGVAPAKRASQATLASLTCQMAVWLEPDYIRWLNEDTLLDTADFVKAVARVMPRRVKRKAQAVAARPVARPQPVATMQPQLAFAAAGASPVRPVHPVHQAGTPQTNRPQAVKGAARFPDVDMTSRRLEAEYDNRNRAALDQSDLHELSDLRTSFHDDERDEELEAHGIAAPRNSVARLATWAVSITVGIFSMPLAAFLLVYNLFRGEDFRLSAQALSLTGLFTVLNANGATAQVIEMVQNIVS